MVRVCNLLVAVCLICPAVAVGEGDSAVSYESEVKPIFREHCIGCHNADEQKGGLALDSYAATIEGGSSGEVVFEGDAEGSRLYQLVNHDDAPEMPPRQDPIADAKRDLIRRWIDEGLAEHSGAARKAKKNVSLTFQTAADDDTPGAMPSGINQQPVIVTDRPAAVSALAVSPRAPLLAVSGERQVAIYQSETLELLGIVPFPEGTPHVIRFSRDGSLLLIAGGRGADRGHVALHDVKTGKRLIRVGDELDVVLAADIDRQLRFVVLGGPTKIAKIFDASSGQELFKIKKHTDWITAAEFSPDGKFLATADRAGGLILWEAATAREYQVFEGHKSAISRISWRADSRAFATGAEEGNVRLWDPEKSKPLRNFGHGSGVTSVRMASDGGIVSGGRDRRVKRWDANGKQLKVYEAMTDIVTQVAITHDRKWVFAGDWNGQVRAFATESEKHCHQLDTNPPTLQFRMAEVQQSMNAQANVVKVALEELHKRRTVLKQLRSEYAVAVERLDESERQARAANRQVYELTRLRENDEVADDFAAGKQVATEKSRRDAHVTSTGDLYNQVKAIVDKISVAREAMSTARSKVAEDTSVLRRLQKRVEEFAAMIKEASIDMAENGTAEFGSISK